MAEIPRPDRSFDHILAASFHHENEDPLVAAARLEVVQRVSAEQRAEMWKKRALTDELTGLPNRRAVMQTLGNLVLHEPGTFGLMFIDLDDLKEENKKGYGLGDQLLVRTATSIIGGSVRTVDTAGYEHRPHDIEGSDVARLGGDEFLVVVQNLVDDVDPSAPDKPLLSAQDKLTIVNHRIITKLEDASVRASTGMAIHQVGQTAEDLVHYANRAADIDKSERRAEKQTEELAQEPEQERENLLAVKALADQLDIPITKLWRYFGPTSR